MASKGTRCTKFNHDVLEERDSNGDLIKVWCMPGSKPSEAICVICNTTIDCSQRGSSSVKRHASNARHIEKCNKNRKEDGSLKQPPQLRFSCTNSKSGNITVLSHQDKILSSEILFSLSVVHSNVSYTYGDVATSMFPRMFSDSTIAKDFSCGRTKLSYLISDGIGPHLKSKLLDEIVKSNSYFSLQIDETPVPEKRSKQLDLFVRFYSEVRKQVVVNHLESFLIGHGTAEILFGKVNDALLHLPDSKLINLFSDGPNVMKSLKAKMQEKYPNMLDIGSCNLHVLHNAFAKGLEGFGADVETLMIDLYYFFKRSAAQSEDLTDIQIEFDFPEHVLLRHVDSRWLTLHSSVDRFIEQFPVLAEFFSGNRSSKHETERFKKICKTFSSKSLLPTAYFLRNVSEIFVNILKLLQKEEPLIHILYDELEQLLKKKTMGRFLKVKSFADLHGSNLASIDVNKGEHWLPNPEVGSDTQNELQRLPASERKSFYLGARSFYIKCTKYLQKMLPLKNKLLRDLKCLHPLYITEQASVSCLKTVASYIPFVVAPSNVSALIDEWVLLQIEDISSIMSSPDEPLDQFWHKVFELKDSLGQPKFTVIPNVVKALIVLSHGNADCERGFSTNKNVLEGRSRLNIESINGIRQIKSFLKHAENIEKINISRDLLNAARNSRKNYFQRLESQKTESEKRESEDNPTSDDFDQLKTEGKILADQLQAAQNMLSLAQSHITNGLTVKDFREIEGGHVLLKEANERIPELVKKIEENKAKQLEHSNKKRKK